MKKIGVLMLTLGALITVVTALNFTFVTEENVIDAGNLQINQRKRHGLQWSPIVGVVIMVAGGSIYMFGIKKKLQLP